MKIVVLQPAYGRDYKSAIQAQLDWNAGKDFRIAGLTSGGYMNKTDAIAYGVGVFASAITSSR